MKDILTNWPVDDTIQPEHHYDSLCHIDYQTDKEKVGLKKLYFLICISCFIIHLPYHIMSKNHHLFEKIRLFGIEMQSSLTLCITSQKSMKQ